MSEPSESTSPGTELTDFVPADWRSSKAGTLVRIVIFRPLRVVGLEAMTGPVVIDMTGVRVLLGHGTVPVLRSELTRDVQFTEGPEPHLHMTAVAPVVQMSPPGPIAAFFLAPVPETERHVWPHRLEAAVAMCTALWGRNFSQVRLTEFDFDLEKRTMTRNGPTIENPLFLPPVVLSPEMLGCAQAFEQDLATLAPARRARTELALRWFFESNRRYAVDALLSAWIAIEAAAMDGDGHIQSLKDCLAVAYGTTASDVAALLHLGRLSSIRAGIVHRGSRLSLPPLLVDYVQALFVDVLDATLNRPCRRLAGARASEARDAIDATLAAMEEAGG